MDTQKKDLQMYKNQLMQLSYNEKIEISEWLHTQIDFERNDAVKEKAKQVNKQFENFLDKASLATKSAGSSLLDSFRNATSKDVDSEKK